MCTVSYVNISKEEFIFTFNRDESTLRQTAFEPKKETVNNQKLLRPTDPKGGGTWIFSSQNGITVGLLNGGFVPHEIGGVYRKSRGLVVLDVLNYKSIDEFLTSVDLTDIEPFTMILIEQTSSIKLKELVWDGKEKHISEKNANQNHIWSSSTLYSDNTKRERRLAFKRQNFTSKEDILQFHHQTQQNFKSIPIVIDRPNTVKTLSTTQIISTKNSTSMGYFNLIDHSNLSGINHNSVFLDK